jgi:hypothetical protein
VDDECSRGLEEGNFSLLLLKPLFGSCSASSACVSPLQEGGYTQTHARAHTHSHARVSALQEGGLRSPRRTIAAGSSWKAARSATIEDRDTQRHGKTDMVTMVGAAGKNRGEGRMQGAPGEKGIDTVNSPVDAHRAGFTSVSASSPWKME